MEKLKELRDISGAGMVDCKKALDETGGNIEKALEILRKKGIAKAAKRGDREMSQGVIKLCTDKNGDKGYMVEVNAETDFVARNEKFQNFADSILELIKTNKPNDMSSLLSMDMRGASVEEALGVLSGTIGEKMGIKGYSILKGETVSSYSHLNGKIGVLVALDRPDKGELAMDIAMQIAAANPKYLSDLDVPADELAREKDIYREQLKNEGKPEQIIEKIIEGKIKKFYSEVCLLDQEYIKDDKKIIREILGDINVTGFARYSLA